MSNFSQVFKAVTDNLAKKKKYDTGIVTSLVGGALKGIKVVETGIPQLDVALGVGGLPKGRIVEVYGPESAGKTTLCLKLLSQAQQEGEVCAIVDAEHALDIAWAEKIGVDTKELMISQPDCGEDCLEIAHEMIDSGAGFIIIDSVSAMVPRAELEGEFGQSHMGLQARMMSQAMRKLVGIVKKKEAILIFTNQIRMKIGVMFGNPETTPGGNALKFSASIRLDIRKGTQEAEGSKEDKVVTGMMTRIKVVKNKVAPPFKICNALLDFETGFDTVTNLFEVLIGDGVIEKRGSTYAIENMTLGHGKKNALAGFQNMDDEELGRFYSRYVDSKLNKDVDEDAISDEEMEEIKKLKKKKKGRK